MEKEGRDGKHLVFINSLLLCGMLLEVLVCGRDKRWRNHRWCVRDKRWRSHRWCVRGKRWRNYR